MGFYLSFAVVCLIVIALRWIIYRQDISRIRKLLQRDDSELLTYKTMFFGPNWLSVWLTGCREFSIRYQNSQSAKLESNVLTSVFFGTQFFNEKLVEQIQNDNDKKLSELIEFHKNN